MSETLPRDPSSPAAPAFRRLAYSDLPAVIAIERRSFPAPWSLAMFVLELSKPSGICLAASAEDELHGYLVCSRYDQVWHLMNVAVAPERRRGGVASGLIRRLLEETRSGTALPVTLEVRVSNADAIAMYEGLGFRSAGVRPRYYQDNGEDALIMWLDWRSVIFAIETSCDDTCAAVLDGRRILSNVISSQAEAHARFGGIVPEVASRHHLELAVPIVEAALSEAAVALDDIEAVAVTTGPGLIGALLVGVSTAKAIAAPRRLPLIPVDHLQGHVAANFLEPDPLEPPFICLVASGGHTMLAAVRDHDGHEVLGSTLDDAAGEAFDKVARLLGLGYPGGPALERLAADGDPGAFDLPVAMTRNPGLDFSFSGLKTALAYLCRDLGPEGVEERRADLAAGFQAAAVGQLTAKLDRALRTGEWDAVALGGGVAANGPLRESVAALCEQRGVELKLVPIELCTDNAAMIGSAALDAPHIEYPSYLAYDAFPTDRAAA